MISIAEQNRRRKAVEYSIATCELEGCIISDEYRKLSEKYIKGEMTLEEMGKIIRRNLPSNKSKWYIEIFTRYICVEFDV